MVNKADTKKARLNRHRRVRGKVSGTAECPRLNVFRSSKNIYAQIIDDVKGVTLAAASTLDKDFSGNGGNKDAARKVGEMIAKRAAEKGIEEVVLDVYKRQLIYSVICSADGSTEARNRREEIRARCV